jgi:hypothetical protein
MWGDNWTTYCSEKNIDDSLPIPKFCSRKCRKQGGPAARLITEEMKQRARDAEWREPETAYREATGREKYDAAAYQQRKERK